MYRDDKNDFITLSAETDLRYALSCANKTANDHELYELCVEVEQSQLQGKIENLLTQLQYSMMKPLKLANEHFLHCLGLGLLIPLRKWVPNSIIVKAR